VVAGYYRWIAFAFPCFAVMFTLQGILRGAGDTMALLALAFVSQIGIRAPLAYWLSGKTGLAEHGIWIAMLVSAVIGTALSFAYYAGGRWKKMKALARKTDAPPVIPEPEPVI
jgi:Na+-driven multidrug efflux pump